MALQSEFEYVKGLVAPNAYARIGRLTLESDPRAPFVEITVAVYPSVEAFNARNIDPLIAETHRFTAIREPDPENAGQFIPSYADVVGNALVLAGDTPGTPVFNIVRRNLYAFLATRQKWQGAAIV